MNIEIREMIKDDLDDVYSIELECFKHPWKRKDWEYELEGNPINKILVACVDGKIVGFNDYMITFNSSTVSQIAVASSYRRNGIASMLMKKMEESFPHEGDDEVETVTLEVRESNESARNLYKKLGYEEVVVKPHYYDDGENAIYMVKRLLKWR